MFQVQKVLAGHRITIFDEAREKLRIKIGDYVIVKVEEDRLIVMPAEIRPRTTTNTKS